MFYYMENDLIKSKFAQSQGREYVLTKALPKEFIEAFKDVINKAPKFDVDGFPIRNAAIIKLLEKQYGNDFIRHSKEVQRRMKGHLESPDRAKLLKAVSVLGDPRVPVSLRKLTIAEKKLVADLEGSGYRIGRMPKKTIISQAADITGTKFAKETLVAHRSTIGKLVDNFGLSPENIPVGSQFFMFRDAFQQGLIKEYGF